MSRPLISGRAAGLGRALPRFALVGALSFGAVSFGAVSFGAQCAAASELLDPGAYTITPSFNNWLYGYRDNQSGVKLKPWLDEDIVAINRILGDDRDRIYDGVFQAEENSLETFTAIYSQVSGEGEIFLEGAFAPGATHRLTGFGVANSRAILPQTRFAFELSVDGSVWTSAYEGTAGALGLGPGTIIEAFITFAPTEAAFFRVVTDGVGTLNLHELFVFFEPPPPPPPVGTLDLSAEAPASGAAALLAAAALTARSLGSRTGRSRRARN